MNRVTLADVAAHAGVSRSAASLAVRGTGRLSEETRARIKASMTELGYVYHRGAANLRTRTSSLVGLMITDLSNPFFAEMSLGFEKALAESGYITVISNTFDDPTRFTELARAMLEHPVDALVYVPVADGPAEPFADSAVPSLAATRAPGDDSPFLGLDDTSGGYNAARHLIDVHGRLRFAYLGGPERAGARGARLAGVQRAMLDSDASLLIQVPGITSVESGYEIVERYLDSGVECDALVCHSDIVAFAACAVLRERGLRVPDDVSVIGFDGLDLGALFTPALTSMSAGPRRVGERCADWVLRTLNGDSPPRRTLLDPALIIRSSCGC